MSPVEAVDAALGRFLAERIAGARLLLVEEAGHCVQLEQPDMVNAGIREFLGALSPGGRGQG